MLPISPSSSSWGVGVGHSGTCWVLEENRDNLGKDAGEKGKRRMTGKVREERKEVGSPWSSKWRRWPGAALREPVLWSSDQEIRGMQGTSGMWSRSVGDMGCYRCQGETSVPLLPGLETFNQDFHQEILI